MAKKVIHGKRYDTDTAKKVGEVSKGAVGSFSYWEETLFQKRTGEFFIYGMGGAHTHYSRRVDDNNFSGGDEIRPLSIKEAQEWAEEHLDGEEYEEIFGVVEEDRTLISIWIPDTLKAEADNLREQGYTQADIFAAGVEALKK